MRQGKELGGIQQFQLGLEVLAFILFVAAVVFLGGCSSAEPPRAANPAAHAPAVVAPSVAVTPSAPTAPAKQPVARRGWVHFDTASAVVSDASVVELRKLARFLRGHPDVTVVLEGNCDERGSYAYNQRLGAARADSVAKVLAESGVSAERIKTGSNGEFKPMASCHAEVCWAVNRRVDVIYGGW